MKLLCHICKSNILPDDIDIHKVTARCRQCGATFNFREMLPNTQHPPIATMKDTIEQPAEFTVKLQNDELIIDFRWFDKSAITKLIASLISCTITFLLFWFLISGGLFQGNGIGLAVILFPILISFPTLCLWAFYRAICKLINHTTISINNDYLIVNHQPLPFNRNLKIPVESIKQLHCIDKILWEDVMGEKRNMYHLILLLKDGKKLLISEFNELTHAGFIEQQIETRLGIADIPIDGKISWI